MKINYRIDNLELRLNDLPEDTNILHSPWSEIVQWSELKNGGQNHCWTIATFEYDRDGYPELHYCGNRPTELPKEYVDIFLELINEGYKYKRVDGVITKIDYSEEYD
jgi:hypothetical protein